MQSAIQQLGDVDRSKDFFTVAVDGFTVGKDGAEKVATFEAEIIRVNEALLVYRITRID